MPFSNANKYELVPPEKDSNDPRVKIAVQLG